VITIRGTTGLEAAFYEKPSLVFNKNSGYSELPSVTTIKKIEELPEAIKTSLKNRVKLSDLNKYVDYIEKNSVIFEQVDFTTELSNRFSYGAGFLNEENIPPKELKLFLDEFDEMFDRLTSEYLKKINESKIN